MEAQTDTLERDDDDLAGGMSDYRSAVLSLSQDLGRLLAHAEVLELEGSASQTRTVLDRLKKDRFLVAVVGEFNRGKSTLINALLGSAVLPMDILPCTAAINRVTYSHEKRAVIEFRDGLVEEVPYDALKAYITKLSEDAEERALSIRESTIFYPSHYCANDVDVVDTPGLNEDQAMTDITLSVLPHSDVAIMVIMANAPFGMYEQEFLRDHLLTGDIGRVMFVVNAIDGIDAEDRPRLIETVEQRIKSLVMERLARHLGEDSEEYRLKAARLGEVKAIGISARKALRAKAAGDLAALEESGFGEFERRLNLLLTDERAGIRLQIPIARAINGGREIAEAIRLRDRALQMDAGEFERAANAAEADIRGVRADWSRRREELDEAEKNTGLLARGLAVEFIQDLKEQTLEVIDALPIGPDDLRGGGRKSLKDRLAEERGKRRNDLIAIYQAKLEVIVTGQIAGEMDRLKEFEADLMSLMDRIDQRFSDLADVDLARPAEGVMGAIAVFTGFGGLWSGYKVAGLKGAAAGGAAAVGGAIAGGAVLALIGAPITFPIVIGLGVLSIFTGDWAARLLFGGEEERRFREKARQAALREIDNIGVEQVADQLSAVATGGFRTFKQQVIVASESKLNDTTRQLQKLREDYVQKGAANEADRRNIAEVAAEVERIAVRAADLAHRYGLGAPPAMNTNPTESVALDFPGYVAARRRVSESHRVNGVPDYGFALDRRLRGRLGAMAPVRSLARTLVRAQEPLMQQINLMNGVAVGPQQYPEIFAIGERCARTLGIGVPRIFILPSETANAWTYASDDTRPSVVLTTRVMRNLTSDELTGIIGHECGHIHNLHSAYNTLVELTANTALRGLLFGGAAGGSLAVLNLPLALLGGALRLFMLEWSRAAEITADRAGAICAGGVRPMMMALMKLKTGAELELAEVNVDAYLAQFEQVRRSPVKLSEFLQTHPITQKRIAALRLFQDSEVFHSWRGAEMAVEGLMAAEELDRRCEALIRVA